MDLEEIKQKRSILAQEIYNLTYKFTLDTGVQVGGINCIYADMKCGPPSLIGIEVKIELR